MRKLVQQGQPLPLFAKREAYRRRPAAVPTQSPTRRHPPHVSVLVLRRVRSRAKGGARSLHVQHIKRRGHGVGVQFWKQRSRVDPASRLQPACDTKMTHPLNRLRTSLGEKMQGSAKTSSSRASRV